MHLGELVIVAQDLVYTTNIGKIWYFENTVIIMHNSALVSAGSTRG